MSVTALDVIGSRLARPYARTQKRATLDEILQLITLDGGILLPTTMTVPSEEIESSFLGYSSGFYQRNGIVFACLMTRYLLFSQARFQWQQMRGGQPGNLFGTPELAPLENPDDGRSTSDLLARMFLDNDLAGIGYTIREGRVIKRLRPDWTAAVFGSERPDAVPSDPDSRLIGYAYMPGGLGSGAELMRFGPEQVRWFSTVPDAVKNVVGMSWLTPILRDVMGDNAASIHKLAYWRNAATPNLAVTMPTGMPKEKAEQWIELFEQEHRGGANAFRSMYFGGGAVATVIGAQLGQLDYRNIRAADETRIAAAAAIHPVLLGISEGLQGSALNAGNFAAAARWTADRLLYSAWGNAAGSLQGIVRRPNPASRLWYDTKQVPFLRDDIKARAQVMQAEASIIGGLIKDGYEPGSIVDSVMADGDWTRLVHTGLVSVQLQPPGTTADPAAEPVRMHHVSPQRLRELLADGHTPASPSDEAAIRKALVPAPVVVSGVRSVRAIGTFWPVNGRTSRVGTIEAGTELPSGDAVVVDFPGMFEPVTERPGLVITRLDVLTKRAALIAAGRPAGIDSVARELGVNRETVRRRLREEPPTVVIG